jgi:hypothetical protein
MVKLYTHTHTHTHNVPILVRGGKSLRILENNNDNTQVAHSKRINMVLEQNQLVSVTFFLPSMLKLRGSTATSQNKHNAIAVCEHD